MKLVLFQMSNVTTLNSGEEENIVALENNILTIWYKTKDEKKYIQIL